MVRRYEWAGKYPGQEIIRQARLARGWTQKDLAQRLYVVKTMVYRYETGRTKAPWDELYRILPELKELRK